MPKSVTGFHMYLKLICQSVKFGTKFCFVFTDEHKIIPLKDRKFKTFRSFLSNNRENGNRLFTWRRKNPNEKTMWASQV